MIFFKILYYMFTLRYRIIEMDLHGEKKEHILLWGVVNQEGWEAIKKGLLSTERK